MLHSDICVVNQRRIGETIAEFRNAEIRFVQMQGLLQDLFDVTASKVHFSKEMFYKLLAPSIFSQHDKILVTDVDVAFLGDILRDYFALGTNDDVYLAGPRVLVTRGPWLEQLKRDYGAAGFSADEIVRLRTIAAGYFVANLVKMREDKLEERFIESARANAHRLILPEQDVLNLICHPKIRFLPVDSMVGPGSNAHDFAEGSANEVKQALDHPEQLHYAGPSKPWNQPDCLKSGVWFEILARTPFLRDQLITMSRKSDVSAHRELIGKLHEGIHARDARIDGLKADVFAMRQSTSWKLTAPMRSTIHLLRLAV